MAVANDSRWDPDQYERFKAERARPFWDLLALVQPCPGGRVVDLGCGTGELTKALHTHLGALETVGIDSSPAMLERAQPFAGDGLRFDLGDIADWDAAPYDVVFSNAALHWLPDHRRLLGRLTQALPGGGQLAVQVPANTDHPSHTVGLEVAHEEPFTAALAHDPPPDPGTRVLLPEQYAAVLDELGFGEQHVRLQVYAHRLTSSAEVVEWVKGTALTFFRTRLSDELYELFLERYRRRLLEVIGDRQPYLYTFKRILFWGRRTWTVLLAWLGPHDSSRSTKARHSAVVASSGSRPASWSSAIGLNVSP
jgi:trans-aconitate 2-methyltransferase